MLLTEPLLRRGPPRSHSRARSSCRPTRATTSRAGLEPGRRPSSRAWSRSRSARRTSRELVVFARENGLRVVMQGTGHNATPLGDIDDVVLVRTGAMRGVEIDVVRRVARVEAGAVWADVAAPASEHGLAALAGSAPDVGVVGYVVGGGLGWLGRRYGLALRARPVFDVVTADGRLVRADRDNEPDLFWALRGGGGSYAAIVGLEMELIPVPAVTGGMMLFGWERAREVAAGLARVDGDRPRDGDHVDPDHAGPGHADGPRVRARPRRRDHRRRGRRAAPPRPPRSWRRCARWARRSTRSPRSRRSRSPTSTWTPRSRCRRSPTHAMLDALPEEASTTSSTGSARAPAARS